MLKPRFRIQDLRSTYNCDVTNVYRRCPELPVFDVPEEVIQELALMIDRISTKKEQSKDEKRRKLVLTKEIEAKLRKHNIEEMLQSHLDSEAIFKRLVPYGSAVTRIGLENSDLDLSVAIHKAKDDNNMPSSSNCKTPNKKALNDKKEQHLRWQREVLQWVRKTLSADTPFKETWEFSSFLSVQVPFIRIVANNVSVDITVSIDDKPPVNFGTVQLFNTFSRIQCRFDSLCIFIKCWLRKLSCSSEGSSRETIPNSFSVALLTVHFLQYYGYLPLLHIVEEELFDTNRTSWADVENMQFNFYPLSEDMQKEFYRLHYTMRPVSVGRLFISFLHYYTKIVSLSEEILITKNGKTKKKDFAISHDNSLIIFYPNDKLNPGRTVHNVKSLVECFQKAFEAIVNCEKAENVVEDFLKVKIQYAEPRFQRLLVGRNEGFANVENQSHNQPSSSTPSPQQEVNDEFDEYLVQLKLIKVESERSAKIAKQSRHQPQKKDDDEFNAFIEQLECIKVKSEGSANVENQTHHQPLPTPSPQKEVHDEFDDFFA